ncbi:MAG TPA: ECF transporter S component [Candidatus Bathyarchaeia archaeon]|nr:ECF transporter S component [Candidatus Bathyarchaeia archaeon]
MTQLYIKRKSVFIAGTALLGSMVAVLDWAFKIGGLKIPFPILPMLRFDALGVLMLLSYFLFGFLSGTITGLVAWGSISLRDPTGFSGFMKFLAEFSTIVGVYLVLRARRPASRWWKTLSMASGVLVRVIAMAAANYLLLPVFTTARIEVVVAWLPAISIFNAIQGAVSVFGGFLLYEAVILRLPSLKVNG